VALFVARFVALYERLTMCLVVVYHSIYHNNARCNTMARKFKIPTPVTTTSKSIRIPDELIAQVENAIQGTECSFTAFVNEAIRVALDNLAEEKVKTRKR
jgi:hypothetical protein